MGIYYHVYAGPALVCKYHMAEKVTVEVKTFSYRVCLNESCENHGLKYDISKKDKEQKPKFCPMCGKQLAVQTSEREIVNKKTRKSVDDISEMMDQGGFREDTFWRSWGGLNNESLIKNHDVLSLTNEKVLGRKLQFEQNQFEIHLDNPDIQGEIKKTEEFYAKEIEYLRTKYDSVEVRWLVLTEGC